MADMGSLFGAAEGIGEVGSSVGGAAQSAGSLAQLAQAAQIAGALGQLGMGAYSLANQGGGGQPGMAQLAPTQMAGQVDPRMMARGRANVQARLGGGYSPTFIDSLYGGGAGQSGLAALTDIRSSLG